MTEHEALVEKMAMRLAEVYHGRPVSRDFVMGECTGGTIYLQQARAALRVAAEAMDAVVRDAFEAAANNPDPQPYGRAAGLSLAVGIIHTLGGIHAD